ncbi:hypothetical protein N0V88_006230 [Collariella sp. IMI 366227]|nr:hypothetical protein N0V88_006230 [Collariella sp. IMI 366227]
MKLADLQIEIHHRGHRLVVKLASPVVTLTARSWTMVQDEGETETERLELRSRYESSSIFSWAVLKKEKLMPYLPLLGRLNQRFKDLDSKAYFRAGSAAYNQGNYKKATNFFKKRLQLMPENKNAHAFLHKFNTRLREQEVGSYSLKKIKASLSPTHPRVDLDKAMDLYKDCQPNTNSTPLPLMTKDGPTVNTLRVNDIVSHNAFGPVSQFGKEGSAGLWILTAYIIQSFVANAGKEYVGDLMVIRATRDIVAEGEIFHAYDELSDYEAKQRALMTTWEG